MNLFDIRKFTVNDQQTRDAAKEKYVALLYTDSTDEAVMHEMRQVMPVLELTTPMIENHLSLISQSAELMEVWRKGQAAGVVSLSKTHRTTI